MSSNLTIHFADAHGAITMAAHAILYCGDTLETMEVFLNKRSMWYEEKGHGGSGLLGGEEEPGEEEDIQALIRELIEETGAEEDPEIADLLQKVVVPDNVSLIHQEVLRKITDDPEWGKYITVNRIFAIRLTSGQFGKLKKLTELNEEEALAASGGQDILSDGESKGFNVFNFSELVRSFNAASGMSFEYETHALLKLHSKMLATNELPLTGDHIIGPGGESYDVLDKKRLDFSGAVQGFKHAPVRVEIAEGGEKVVTRPIEQNVTGEEIAEEGDVIITILDYDQNGRLIETQDRYIPKEDGVNCKFPWLLAHGFTKIDSQASLGGLYKQPPQFGMVELLPYAVRRPTVILDAYGEGHHQFLQTGASIKRTSGGRVSGVPSHVFTTGWTIPVPGWQPDF